MQNVMDAEKSKNIAELIVEVLSLPFKKRSEQNNQLARDLIRNAANKASKRHQPTNQLSKTLHPNSKPRKSNVDTLKKRLEEDITSIFAVFFGLCSEGDWNRNTGVVTTVLNTSASIFGTRKYDAASYNTMFMVELCKELLGKDSCLKFKKVITYKKEIFDIQKNIIEQGYHLENHVANIYYQCSLLFSTRLAQSYDPKISEIIKTTQNNRTKSKDQKIYHDVV